MHFWINSATLSIEGQDDGWETLYLRFTNAVGVPFPWTLKGREKGKQLFAAAQEALSAERTHFSDRQGGDTLDLHITRRGVIQVNIFGSQGEEYFWVEDAEFSVAVWEKFVEYLRLALHLPQPPVSADSDTDLLIDQITSDLDLL